ncbi:MAG: HAD hydrolase-like protein [Gammaproteobacteria bacterium]|nr:HAD hydrolase-like protein [Gammaproteobacteria bacterium]MDH3448111.1 HAD hydrolase-like protein [Gammaproteobacteria bacterium]
MKLSDFKMLTFDTYGTLIDWESGIYNALQPLLDKVPIKLGRDEVLELFAEFEIRQQTETPTRIYSALLADVARAIAVKWQIRISDEEAIAFGRSVKDWPAFADSPAALDYLRQHYLMATVTNCDRISYMGSNARLEIEWDAIYTAQDIGCYKPSLRNFEYLFEHARRDLGILPQEILHVAQSLTHDMVPATQMGMTKVWINRRHGQEGLGATAPPQGDYTIEWEFPGMAEFVEAHRQERG